MHLVLYLSQARFMLCHSKSQKPCTWNWKYLEQLVTGWVILNCLAFYPIFIYQHKTLFHSSAIHSSNKVTTSCLSISSGNSLNFAMGMPFWESKFSRIKPVGLPFWPKHNQQKMAFYHKFLYNLMKLQSLPLAHSAVLCLTCWVTCPYLSNPYLDILGCENLSLKDDLLFITRSLLFSCPLSALWHIDTLWHWFDVIWWPSKKSCSWSRLSP